MALAAAALVLSSASAFAAGERKVGGAAMSPEKAIVQNASAAHNLSTLVADVQKGGGKAMLKTVRGEDLTVTRRHGHVMIADAAGHEAEVTMADVEPSNGVVHLINRVLLP